MTEKQFFNTMASPVGQLILLSNGAALTGVYMEQHKGKFDLNALTRDDGELFAETERQLRAYFAGELTEFDLPLAPRGTEFQQRVWTELQRIPYGATISYAELARRTGNERAVRAVGAANGRNPISIIVPCHRVIGSNKTLTGYAGGVERKQMLLELEAQSTQRGGRRLSLGL